MQDDNLNNINGLINTLSAKYKMDPELIRRVVHQESRFNPNATSRAGAQGLMQLMPETAKELGVQNSFDPAQNLEGGIKYLSQQSKRFGGDMRLALAAYNAGAGNVIDAGNQVPNFKETKNYVHKIWDTWDGNPNSVVPAGYNEKQAGNTPTAKAPSNDLTNKSQQVNPDGSISTASPVGIPDSKNTAMVIPTIVPSLYQQTAQPLDESGSQEATNNYANYLSLGQESSYAPRGLGDLLAKDDTIKLNAPTVNLLDGTIGLASSLISSNSLNKTKPASKVIDNTPNSRLKFS